MNRGPAPIPSAPAPRNKSLTRDPADPSLRADPSPQDVRSESVESAPIREGWTHHLSQAIDGLKAQTSASPQGTDDLRDHAALRMLYLAAGQRDKALDPIPGAPALQQDFWSNQLFGLATYLDHEQIPRESDRARRAKGHLVAAASRLGQLGPLAVRNLAFCSEVRSYGVYEEFDSLEFEAGQQVLLYAEVDNYTSQETEKGFHTALKSGYEIWDDQGERIDRNEFSVTDDHCQNRRHDFFMRYRIHMPDRIKPGEYTLRLTIEDVQSGKFDHAQIEFRIKR